MADALRSSWSWPGRYPAPPPSRPQAPIGIALHDLSPEKRQRVWKWMKANDPAMLKFLESADYKIAREFFNASPVVTREYLDRALRAVP